MALSCVSYRFLTALVLSVHAAALSTGNFAGASEVQDARLAVRLLSDRCFKCHGPDAATREAGLRLDNLHAAITQLESGETAIVPGDLDTSALIARITEADESLRMPPIDSGKSLSAEEIEVLKRWISAGAEFPRHWAYGTPQRPAVPQTDPSWGRNAIDAFVLAKLRSKSLAPSSEASKERLIRRLSFDLTGLPPSADDIDAFVNDASPHAYDKLVDRLLASPHYGERMAAEWLDLARYADTNGYQNDFARQQWPWRDWVITAFNDNMPYDKFLIEQIAGDMLPNATDQQRLATGFNRNHRTVTEAGTIDEEWRVENVVDRVDATATAMLGLTMGCARCHDHKFDPISQQEFYEFYAFFNNVNERGVYTEQRGNVPPLLSVPSDEQRRRHGDFEREQTELRSREAGAVTAVDGVFDEWLAQLKPSAEVPLPAMRVPLERDGVAQLASGKSVEPQGDARPSWPPDGSALAAKFDGAQVLEYPAGFEFAHDRPFTAMALVKLEGEGAVFSKMDDVADFRGVDLAVVEDGRLACHIIHRWSDDCIKVVAKERPPRGEWLNVALVYDGSQKASGVTITLNGKPLEVETLQDSLQHAVTVGQPLRVGRRSTQRPLKGLVRDLRFFDSKLEQIAVANVAEDMLASVAEGEPSEGERRTLLRDYFLATSDAEGIDTYNAIRAALPANAKALEELKGQVPTAMVMEERTERRPTFVLKRGAYDQPDESRPVEPDVPGFLPPLPQDAPRNRVGLAQWIVNPANPLTARVAVNRLWQQFFGMGLVKTSENFGLQAEPPSHTELLDWLAIELIESGWDIQHIQRLIATSATYRQSSDAPPEAYAADPDNRMLARGPRRRLSAEMVRDNALAVSGLISKRIGGPSIMPYQPPGLWEELAGGAHEDYVQVHGDDLYRRSLYVYRKRTVPHPTMNTFDAPSWDYCQAKRATTNTPLQALALLNDVTYVEAARKLAERMLHDGGADDVARLTAGYRWATGRVPTTRELAVLRDALVGYRAEMQRDAAAAEALLAHGETRSAIDASPEELAATTLVASILLNLDETVTKN
jgi:hypothetical protein